MIRLRLDPVLEYRVYGTPAPQGSKTGFVTKRGKAVVVDGSSPEGRKKHKSWRAEVALASQEAALALPEPLDGPVHVEISFFLNRPASIPKKRFLPWVKPDIDKLLRSTFDSMSGQVFSDDARVTGVAMNKYYATQEYPEGAEITVSVVSEWVPRGLISR